MLQLTPFLTAYDPSDLPGGSIDPLGFERGYLLLADKILPGLTNVASRPRYFSLLCAGVVLADEAPAGTGARETDRQRKQFRLDCILRLERFWALGNVLAAEKNDDDELGLSGIRGVRYAQAHAKHLRERSARDTNADFRLLSRQMPYGVIGIYAAISDGMRIIDRDTLGLTPDLGARLGEAFLDETNLPTRIRKAVVDEHEMVPLSTLADWGTRAHVSGQMGSNEAACLHDALQQNQVRWRMAKLLIEHPSAIGEPELTRLERIATSLSQRLEDADLLEAIQTILAYERCYRLVLLGFQRLLWMCQAHPPFQIELASLDKDHVLAKLGDDLRDAYEHLAALLRTGATEAFRRDLHRIDDVRSFLDEATSVTGARPLVEALLRRHSDVQRKKIDGGRPKMPWLEVSGGFIRPTLGRALRVDWEPSVPDEIAQHAYRVASADALIHAAGLA